MWVLAFAPADSCQTKAENFDNLYIPGFHRTYDGDFGVGFNYTILFLPDLQD
jgi:hypothetical protein